MDVTWAVTIAANLVLLAILLRRAAYLDFPFLTFLVAFNALTAPAVWYVYARLPDYYSALYYGKMYSLVVLWFAVTIEAHLMRKPEIAAPVEFYAFVKIFTAVSAHVGFVECAYWINQGMRLFNFAIILVWIVIFSKKEEVYYAR